MLQTAMRYCSRPDAATLRSLLPNPNITGSALAGDGIINRNQNKNPRRNQRVDKPTEQAGQRIKPDSGRGAPDPSVNVETLQALAPQRSGRDIGFDMGSPAEMRQVASWKMIPTVWRLPL